MKRIDWREGEEGGARRVDREWWDTMWSRIFVCVNRSSRSIGVEVKWRSWKGNSQLSLALFCLLTFRVVSCLDSYVVILDSKAWYTSRLRKSAPGKTQLTSPRIARLLAALCSLSVFTITAPAGASIPFPHPRIDSLRSNQSGKVNLVSFTNFVLAKHYYNLSRTPSSQSIADIHRHLVNLL